MAAELRVNKFKTCPFPGCDWRLVQSWFVGSPYNVVAVPEKTQEKNVTEHMKAVHDHSGPPSKIFI